MKIILIVVIALVALVAVTAILGSLLPKHHIASRSAVLRSDPRTVYDAVRSRAGMKNVEILSPTRFRQDGVTYDIENEEPGRTFATRIVDTNLGYSGSWTYLFEPVAEGTRLTITENGEVSNVIFRFMSVYVFGQTATMEKTLASLQSAVGRV